jgi:RND family efflux transporter MFP subunit
MSKFFASLSIFVLIGIAINSMWTAIDPEPIAWPSIYSIRKKMPTINEVRAKVPTIKEIESKMPSKEDMRKSIQSQLKAVSDSFANISLDDFLINIPSLEDIQKMINLDKFLLSSDDQTIALATDIEELNDSSNGTKLNINDLNKMGTPQEPIPESVYTPHAIPPIEPSLPPEPESFPVVFKSFHRGTLSAEVTSVVMEITRKMGERFRKGDLLIHLNDGIFKGFKEKALGNLAKAQAEFTSKQELFQENISSYYEVKTAEANVAAATSDLINAEHAIQACFITAPYDGKVVNVFVEEFELIQEGKPLIEIVNDDFLIGQVLAPSKLVPILNVNNPVKIEVTDTATVEEGKILRLDPVIDPASSLLKVDIIVDNRSQRLRSGMVGRVIFEDHREAGYTPIGPYLKK